MKYSVSMLTRWGSETGPEIWKRWETEQLRKGPLASLGAGVESAAGGKSKRVWTQGKNKHISEVLNWRTECLEIRRCGLRHRNNGRRQLYRPTVSGGRDAKLPTRNWTGAHQRHPRGPGGPVRGTAIWWASASFPDPGARVGARGRLGGLRRKARRQDH